MVDKERQGRPSLGENPIFWRQVTSRLGPIQIAHGQVQDFIKGRRFLGSGRDRHENIEQQQPRHDGQLPAA